MLMNMSDYQHYICKRTASSKTHETINITLVKEQLVVRQNMNVNEHERLPT